MINPLRVSFLGVVGFLALVSSTSACATQVVGGGTGGAGGAGGSTSTSFGQGGYMITAPCTNCFMPQAIAIRASQLFGTGGSATTSTSSGGVGGSTGNPDTIYLEVGQPAPTCAAPGAGSGCTSGFQVAIGVPPAMLLVGTMSLQDPALISTFSETMGGGNECSGGGGSFTEGTLQIVAIDAQQITFTLSGTMPLDFGVGSADGTYVAQRCP